ncbi:TetR family transcriptional regulator [Kineococcus sp. R8]|uniref:TetR/AcrR family transcriptional regulator n=1 Tax=Kineococcus siccus TaxID=2696567 RepID=UPI0014128B17|nr:TetR/AcrR family transcriptional regulator [Kineococcus siccus]NAZ84316.1 TetR family transcriptional regulator [Kineococcus siccus]
MSASSASPSATGGSSATAVPAVRAPLQARSRESFARVQDAALALLRERGDDSFTLAEVSARSGVSTGSIYGRIASKDALIRLVHAREMTRIDAVTVPALEQAAVHDTLDATVHALVAAYAGLLQEEAEVLRPFMLRAAHDPEVARTGHESSERARQAFCDALLRHGAEVRRPEPEVAADWCHTVVFSVLARRLGLGSTVEGADDVDLSVMVGNLSSMVTSFLVTG